MAQSPPQPPSHAIETSRLHLRTLRVEDAAALLPMLQRRDMRWTRAGGTVTNLDQAERWVSARALGPDVLNFTIRTRERPEEPIGVMGSHRPAEIGYLLRSDHMGKGYATEACRALIPFLFQTQGSDYIEAMTGFDNVGSLRVLEKSGFTRVATLPRGSDRAGGLPGEQDVLFRIARPGMTLAELGLLSLEDSKDEDRPVPPVE